ncbi:AAA family ATPase [Okeania sp. SIO2B3]|uniref:AAA family ATPase n=1 Tax=Okeania sp. SIO2B3 TaxID=2607784 RepID=UPI0013C0591C|nr:AAA family ATPase [Okeania sp. SIO2B3]NET43517.1 AAA family ATPase [Okeania sp. SIO2B3]
MSRIEFFPTKPVRPDKFVDRKSELDKICDQINIRGHVAIYGSYGMGKSSLLNYIKSRNFWDKKGLDFSEALIVYYNWDGSFTPNSFWQKVLEELRNEAEGDAELQGKINDLLAERIEIRNIRQILRHIGKKEKFLLLLLDDYHGILGTQEDYVNNLEKSREMQTFLSGLRNLAVHSTEGQYFSTVVAAFRRLNELGPKLPRGGSPWYNHYLYVDLKPFSREDIEQYFFTPNQDFFISIPDNIQKDKVLEITGRYPILLQHAGHIFSLFSQSERDIDINSFKEEFKNQTEQIFKDIWRDLTADEQNLLQLIVIDNLKGEVSGKRYSVDDIDKVFDRNSYTLKTLEQKGVIYKNSEQDKYNFYSSLMQDLVIQEFAQNVSDPKKLEILFDRFGIKIIAQQVDRAKETLPFVIKIVKPIIKPFLGIFSQSKDK